MLVPIATGLLAAAVELGILRPIRQADMFALITSTIFIGIGLSEVYRLFRTLRCSVCPTRFPGPPIFIGDVIITKEQIWVFVGAILSSLIGTSPSSAMRRSVAVFAPWRRMRGAPCSAAIRPTV